MGSAHTHWLPGGLSFFYDASLHLTWFLVQVLMECAIYDKPYVKRQGQVQAMLSVLPEFLGASRPVEETRSRSGNNESQR